MPLNVPVRYRYKTNPDGSKVRLAFKKGTNQVVEVKKPGKPARKVS